MSDQPHEAQQVSTSERLAELLALYPHLAERILRQILYALHERGIVTIDQVYDEARTASGGAPSSYAGMAYNPNVAAAPRGDQNEREQVNELTQRYATQSLSSHDIDELVNLCLKREEADKLRAIVSLGSLSFRLLADAVRRFCSIPEGETHLTPDEAMGIRVGLIRHLVCDQLEFIAVAKKHLRIRDFDDILQHVIGSESGIGKIGGKAAGITLAAKILGARVDSQPTTVESARHGSGLASALADMDSVVMLPESYYLRSDVIEDFIAFNRFGEYQNQKYKTPEEIRREYPVIRSAFRNGEFPAGIVERLRAVLERIGTHPVVVRSSSLLEDRFGTAFSGKYASIFVGNQGNIEERMGELLGAIAEVYASALGPDPLMYRREHDLSDYEEDMAVLIQKVIGRRMGPYFAPVFAGVAFSRNEYRWSPRIKREDGLLRIVMGLGTRAVDRIGSESARLVALGMPSLRYESSVGEIKRHAQRTIDVINLESNRMESISLDELLKHAGEIPMLDRIVSIERDGMLAPPAGTFIDADPREMYVTFDKLMNEGSFAAQMRDVLHRLEEAYGFPLDVEFAHDGRRLYLLQCRPLSQLAEIGDVTIPAEIPDERTVFSAAKFVRSGVTEQIEFIVYIDPRDYDQVPSRERRTAIARVVGRINDKLATKRFILIGPGRWGSNDVRLGVPVTYADINKSQMLIEVARERDGYLPEVSFGTHFFQDLIEANIAYLPLYPDDRRNRFNETFLSGSANSLASLLPDDAEFADCVQVIDVPRVTGGRHLRVVMDGDSDKALGYLVD